MRHLRFFPYASLFLMLGGIACGGPAQAHERAQVVRKDAARVTLSREDAAPLTVWLSADTQLDPARDRRIASAWTGHSLEVALPASRRAYLLLQGAGDAPLRVVAERALPLEKGSNFRDIGGYTTRDGNVVRWGKVFRSGAQPKLTPADFALVDQLGLGTVVDLRSLEEREINPDVIDDREGALFISNDYSMKAMMAGKRPDDEQLYKGLETILAPQLRSLYRQIMASGSGEGEAHSAILYHCSAGQDRTGVATALLYDVLGVDRATILADYHLSTQLRRPANEFPDYDPADYPDNAFAQMMIQYAAQQQGVAQPLYTPSGVSHLARFFAYLDARYGGSEGYMKLVLGFDDVDIDRLRAALLR